MTMKVENPSKNLKKTPKYTQKFFCKKNLICNKINFVFYKNNKEEIILLK